MWRFFFLSSLVAFLSACSSPGTSLLNESEEEAPSATAEKTPLKSQPLKYLKNRNLKAIPDQPLNVKAHCGFHDVNGGRGRLDLVVDKADVKNFIAQIEIPKQGTCRFDMAAFTQTDSLPNVVLAEKGGACTVRMWEQELNKKKSVTVSFNSCQSSCSGDAFSYLWPILVDPRTGRCS